MRRILIKRREQSIGPENTNESECWLFLENYLDLVELESDAFLMLILSSREQLCEKYLSLLLEIKFRKEGE